MIIDTPGIRSFGLAHVDVARIITAFPDLAALTDGLPARLLARRARLRPQRRLRGRRAIRPTLAARIDSLRRLIRSRTSAIDDDPATSRARAG